MKKVKCIRMEIEGEDYLICKKKVYRSMSADTYKNLEIGKLIKKRR